MNLIIYYKQKKIEFINKFKKSNQGFCGHERTIRKNLQFIYE